METALNVLCCKCLKPMPTAWTFKKCLRCLTESFKQEWETALSKNRNEVISKTW